jgi:rhodanese-related sulfurtransferase
MHRMLDVRTIDRGGLERKMAIEPPDNDSKSSGYALINVLDRVAFARQHIPNSINVPLADLDTLFGRYSKRKEIIVYCASLDCDASPRAAAILRENGFEKVYDYAEGVTDWREAGNRLTMLEQH